MELSVALSEITAQTTEALAPRDLAYSGNASTDWLVAGHEALCVIIEIPYEMIVVNRRLVHSAGFRLFVWMAISLAIVDISDDRKLLRLI